MHDVQTFSELLGLWPEGVLHRDLQLPYETVRHWGRRQSIPVRWWGHVIASAERQGIAGVDNALLLRLAQSSRPARPQGSAA